jgi:peroxiredoxin Q/BCP
VGCDQTRVGEEVVIVSSLLPVGTPAAQFQALTASEAQLVLSDFQGRWLVLYFYPKAHTSGCTREGQAFNGLLGEFEALNAVVVGVSTDKPGTLAKFRDKNDFQFALLSDSQKEISTAYGTLKDHGKSANRVTYLIDPEGLVRFVWPRVKVDGHAEAVLAKLREMAGGSQD